MGIRTCHWCGRSFSPPIRAGPPPRYCCRSHRQRAYEARRKRKLRAGESEGSPGRTTPARSSLEQRRRPRTSGYDLAIKVLGPLEIFRDGDRIEFGRELQGVLAALALRPRQIVPVETLTDSIWPGVDEQAARRRLRTAIWKLRRLLGSGSGDGPDVIRWSPPGYGLDVADDQLDWVRFERLHRAGERALQRGEPRLAKTYLLAARSLWTGSEPLVGIDMPVEDLGSVAQLRILRGHAIKGWVEACFELGGYRHVLPDLENYVAAEPLDEEFVALLATAYYRLDDRSQALSVCRRHLELMQKEGLVGTSARVTDIHAAILRRDLDAGSSANGKPSVAGAEATVGHRAFLSVVWDPYTPSPTGPAPAELLLLVDDQGGTIANTDDTSFEAGFPEVRPTLEAAIELQQVLGEPPLVRSGIEVRTSQGTGGSFEGLPRARARLLASAAREGQILVTGLNGGLPAGSLPPTATLRELGTHRLNALTPPTPVFQLTGSSFTSVHATPRWFDRGPVYNLPDESFRFIGREDEVEEISRSLAEARLLTLTGSPGSGKTRLAAHVAAGLASEYRDGVWFVALQPVSDPGLVAATMAEVLRIPKPGAVHLGTLIRSLRDRHTLVVLDNCEHLLEGCRPLVDGLLPACPGLTILATSREALHSRFERVSVVHPLDPPALEDPEHLFENAAVQLFYDRLPSRSEKSHHTQGHNDPLELRSVARICRAVEGIPLALVLASARAQDVGTAALADLLEGSSRDGAGLKILSASDSPGQSAYVTLDGTIEWSYRLLSEKERLLFDCLSVFQGHFHLKDVVAVCTGRRLLSRDAAAAGLERLVEASLVERVPAEDSFRLLQPMREFAWSRLLRRGPRLNNIRKRHAEHFLAVAEDAEPHVRGPQDQATLDRLDSALPDLYAAIRWAVDQGQAVTALRLVGALWVFWLVRGRIVEGHDLVEAALSTDPTPSPERTKGLVACSQLAWFSGHLDRTLEASREILAVAEATGDEWAWAWGPLGIAAVDMFKGEADALPIRIEETLPTFRALGNDWDTGQAIQTLGGAAWHRGHYEEAEKALAESLALYRSLGHPTLMASRIAHGLMLALLGRADEGAREVEAGIIAAYEAGDLGDLAYALCHRGSIARYEGHHASSRHDFRNALTTGRDAGSMWAVQWALNGLASTDDLGARPPIERIERSVELLARAEALSRETGVILPPREREFHTRNLERARGRLGEKGFAAAVLRGERVSLDEAIDLALTLDQLQARR